MCWLLCRLLNIHCACLEHTHTYTKREMGKEDIRERVRFTAGTRRRGDGGKEGMGEEPARKG